MTTLKSLLEQHPDWPAALKILKVLHGAGHRAVLAGGCVRDACLGILAQDLDIATSALPDEVIALFSKTVEVGKTFGVIRVLIDEADLEVATFRTDGKYEDGRRPTSIEPSDEKHDALRRDFTVNALFYDVDSEKVLDYVDGQKDLLAQILRTVGEPERRFEEDHLRIFRAVRFAVQLGFEVEEETWSQVQKHAMLLQTVSGERIRDELHKLLKSPAGSRGPKLLSDAKVQEALFSDLSPWQSQIEKACEILLTHKESDRGLLLTYWMAGAALENAVGVAVCKQVSSRLKLGRVEEKSLWTRLDFLSRPTDWKKSSLGAQLLFYHQKEIREAWSIYEKLRGLDQERKVLDEKWRKILLPNGKLPPAFLRGDDVKSFCQGPRIGEVLYATYKAQLEGAFDDSQAALTWAQQWHKMSPLQ